MKKNITSIVALILCLTISFMTGCSNSVSENDNQASAQQQENIINKEETNNSDKQSQESDKTEESSIKESEIHFINTGNSDSILIKQGDKAALIDGGDNDDEQRVVSYLKNQGVTKLEYVFATHPDADHIGGLDAVVDQISVENIYVSNGDANTKTYSDFIYAMANKGIGSSVPLLNSEFPLGTSTFKVLSVANEKDVNNNSLVLLYTNGNDKILLMGDAGKEIESKVNAGDVDLIKVGHHGSNTSTGASFIDKVTPEYAVITTGTNKYGHPSKETMDILKNRNIKVYRTDECGDIVFKSSGNGLTTNNKVGSYTPGSKTTSTSTSTNNNSSSTTSNSKEKVYWTPNGKSYHTTKSCPALSRSKVINSGTIEESGKDDPCDRCH